MRFPSLLGNDRLKGLFAHMPADKVGSAIILSGPDGCGKVTAATSVKIHFVDAVVWQNVTGYVWKQKGSTTTALNSWPGEILNRDANGYFTIELDYKPVSGESLGFIFTNFTLKDSEVANA